MQSENYEHMAKVMCYSWYGFQQELNRNGWRDGNLPSDWVFVSIGNYKPKDSEPHILSECEQVINLNFDDISGYCIWDALPMEEWTPEKKEAYKDVYGMSDTDAERLYTFLKKHIGKNVMVHCSAGISRSQGVVRFLTDCYPDIYTETNPDKPCVMPNQYVSSMLKRRFIFDNYSYF